MMQLRTLGGLSVLNGYARVTGTAARRRSLALLALAAAGGDDGVSDEAALALLWPDFDSARARNNLKQVTFALRAALGSEVFDRRPTAIAINRNALEVDLWVFRHCIVAGQNSAAVERYTGPFLEGFHLPGLAEFERWLETERARAAQEFARALKSLAHSATAAARHEQAVGWWRRLVTLDPLSEAHSLGLIRALAASGDVGAALQHGRVHAALVRSELDIEPSSAFRETLDDLRAGNVPPTAPGQAPPSANGQRVVAAVAQSLGATSPDADAGASLGDAAGEVDPPAGQRLITAPWRVLLTPRARHRDRSRWFALASVAVLGMTALASARAVRQPAVITKDSSPGVVVVLPFAVEGDGASRSLSATVTELLATSLDGALGIRAVASEGQPPASGSRASIGAPQPGSIRVAARLRAGLYVSGDVVVTGTQVRISATVRERSGVETAAAQATVQGERNALLTLVDRIAAQLLASRVTGSRHEMARVASLTTPSLDAVKAYLGGEDALRAGRFFEATDHFRSAITLDSGFALAYHGLSMAAELLGEEALARDHARDAVRTGDRLPGRQKRLLRAFLARQRGEIAAAEDLYSEITSDYPADAEAWYGLAETLFHLNPLRGRDPTEAREAFQRVLQLDPGNSAGILHLARIAALQARDGDAKRLLARARAVTSSDVIGRYAGHIMALTGPALDADVARSRLERESARMPGSTMADLLLVPGRDDGLERFLAQFASPNVSTELSAYAARMRSLIAAGRGQVGRAFALIDTAAELQHKSGVEARSRLAALDFLQLDSLVVARVRSELQAWTPPAGLDASGNHEDYADARPYLHLHRLGLLSVRLGDDTTALHYASVLDEMARAPEGDAIGRALAASLRAHLASRHERVEETLQYLRDAQLVPLADVSALEAYDRLLLARLLEERGRTEEALGYYRQIGSRSAHELPFVWPAELGMARIYERRGDPARAAHYYAAVAERLRGADESLRGIAADAERKAEQLARPGP